MSISRHANFADDRRASTNRRETEPSAPELKVVVPPIALALVTALPSVAFEATVTVEAPMDPPANISEPEFTLVGPVYVFAPPKSNSPVPIFVSESVSPLFLHHTAERTQLSVAADHQHAVAGRVVHDAIAIKPIDGLAGGARDVQQPFEMPL